MAYPSSIAKVKLSGSTDGLGIKVVATATLGTTIHTAVAGTTSGTYDEVYLYATNGHTADVALTIEFGGVAIENRVVVTVPFNGGTVLVVPGWILQNAKVVTAFAATANVIGITGFVNAITV